MLDTWQPLKSSPFHVFFRPGPPPSMFAPPCPLGSPPSVAGGAAGDAGRASRGPLHGAAYDGDEGDGCTASGHWRPGIRNWAKECHGDSLQAPAEDGNFLIG